MIQVTAAVENDLGDASFNGLLASDFAHGGSAFNVGAGLAGSLESLAQGALAADGHMSDIVDELHIQVRVGTGNAKARTSGGARNLAADATVATSQPGLLLLEFLHLISLQTLSYLSPLAALPSLRRTCSPS